MKKLLFPLIIGLMGCSDEQTDYLVTVKTKHGDMKAILYEETPRHKENFIKLVKDGFYDSLLFHRVIQNFMIQGGDPDSRDASAGQALGSSGPGYTIPAEFNPRFFHQKGALSAARMGDNVNPNKESSGSQFYIVQGQVMDKAHLTTDLNKLASSISQYIEATNDTLLRNELILLYQTDQQLYLKKMIELSPVIAEELNTSFERDYPADRLKAYTSVGGSQHLDDAYTVFGQVVEGLEVIDKIAAEQTDGNDRPLQDVTMVISLEEVPRSRITAEYGYQYPAPN